MKHRARIAAVVSLALGLTAVPRILGSPGTEPRALYRALNALRVDGSKVYYVHEINLRRSALDITLAEGKLAFFQPLDGRVTGAVFTGQGHIICTPRDAAERHSLAGFLQVPILDQGFSRGYFRFTDDTGAVLAHELEAAGTSSAADQAFADAWNTVAANLNPPHSLRVMFDILSSNPLPYFSGSLGGESVGSFDVLVDRRRPEPVLIGQAHTAGEASRFDVWASFETSDAPAAPEAIAPLDYKVETTIGDGLALEGDAHLHLKARRDGERMLSLELSRSLQIESVSEEGGGPLVYLQNEDMSRAEIARLGNDAVVIVLPGPVHAGQELHLEIRYRGHVIGDAGNGVYYVGERGSWYPHVGGRDYFVPFDLRFRWPRKLTLVATGHKTEEREEGEQRVGHWVAEAPIALAGFNLGEYQRASAGDGHPAIELYANRKIEEAILARLHTGPTSDVGLRRGLDPPGSPDFLGDLMGTEMPPKPAEVLKQLGGEVEDSIHYFERINGPFPFGELAVSPIPGNFGQGWPGLVYLSTLAYLPQETQEEAGVRQKGQEEIAQILPFHEVAHQWWGNVTGTASYRDVWISEAVANYLALMYADSKKPAAHALSTWLGQYRSQLLERVPGSDEVVEDAGPLALGYRLSSSKTPGAYDAIIYGKGTWVIHMLRMVLRQPGSKTPDARFEGMLRALVEQRRFQALTTADLERAVEERMTPAMDLEGGHSLDWFFEEWVRGTGIPHYTVEYQVKPKGAEFVVAGRLKQADVPDDFTEAVPVYASQAGSKSSILLGTVATTGPETAFHFTARFRPARLVIDPQMTILQRTE